MTNLMPWHIKCGISHTSSPAYLICASLSGLLSQSESCWDLSSGLPRHFSTSKLSPVASLYLTPLSDPSWLLDDDTSSGGVKTEEELFGRVVPQGFMLEKVILNPSLFLLLCGLCDGSLQEHRAPELCRWLWSWVEWSRAWSGMEPSGCCWQFEEELLVCSSRGWSGREQPHTLFVWRAESLRPSTYNNYYTFLMWKWQCTELYTLCPNYCVTILANIWRSRTRLGEEVMSAEKVQERESILKSAQMP